MSLRFKMAFGIGAILALVIGEYTILSLRAQARHRAAVVRLEAELIGRVADRAISIAMEEGRSSEVQKLLERMRGQQLLPDIRILDLDGRILRSSDPAEVGRMFPAEDRPPLAAISDSVWTSHDEAESVFRAIPNSARCWGCHGRVQDMLGVLTVQVRLGDNDPQIARQLKIMVGSGTISVLVAGLLIAFLFTFMVGRRVDALAQAMGRVEAGDLTARAPEQHRDELGKLGRSFNVMAAKLADERAQREAARIEEIRQTERMATLEKMAAVGRITSGIAHEINNPLNNISLTVEALTDDFDALTQEVRQRLIRDIGLESDRASEIVRSLLAYVRQESLEMAAVEISAVIESAAGLAASELERNHVTFVREVPAGLPTVRGAASQLRQVFLNLFTNAAHAMPAGGVLRVTASQSPPSGSVRIEVRDDGIGIPADALPRIFDPFFTTKEPGQGTGLGLWVAYNIVQKHGGDIGVSSEPGVGTTFHISLPVTGE